MKCAELAAIIERQKFACPGDGSTKFISEIIAKDVPALIQWASELEARLEVQVDKTQAVHLQVGELKRALKEAVDVPDYVRRTVHHPPAVTIRPDGLAMLERVEIHLKAIESRLTEKPKPDTCENYRDASAGVKTRYCSALESNSQVHAPTCQFFSEKRVEGS